MRSFQRGLMVGKILRPTGRMAVGCPLCPSSVGLWDFRGTHFLGTKTFHLQPAGSSALQCPGNAGSVTMVALLRSL